MSPHDLAVAEDEAPGDGGKPGHSRAAQRTLELIEAVAASAEPMSLSELARATALPKSTAHALAHTLATEGYLERAAEGGRYTLGPRLLRLLGQLPHQFGLPRVARPVLQRVVDEIGETSLLGIRRGPSVLYVEQVEAPHFIRYVAPLAEPRPLYCTSIGKIFLSAMPEDEARELLTRIERPAYTEYTKVDVDEILAELRTVRLQGFATNREESIGGVTAVAAPVHEGGETSMPVIAGVSIVGPSDRFRPKLHAAREALVDAVRDIGLRIKLR